MDYLVIQLDPARLKAGRFRISGASISFAGAAEFQLNDEQGGVSSIVASMTETTIGTPRIILCLPPHLFAHRLVEIPLTDSRKTREVLPAHLQGETALPVDGAVFDLLPFSAGRWLALWASRADVAEMVELFRDAGCEPHIVTSAPFAWRHLPGLPDDCCLCDGQSLGVISNRQLETFRILDNGSSVHQTDSALAALELSGTKIPQRLVCFGDNADEIASCDELTIQCELLELPEKLGIVFKNDNAYRDVAALYAVARACHDGELPDFRRGELAWTAGKKASNRKLLLTAVLATVLLTLLFASLLLRYQALRNDIYSLNNSISTIYREILPGRSKVVDELAEVRGEIRTLAATDSGTSFIAILRKLADARGTTIQALYEAELDGRNLRIKGDARSIQGINEFKASVSKILNPVEVGEIKTRSDGTVTFLLWGTIMESAP